MSKPEGGVTVTFCLDSITNRSSHGAYAP
jgi:hypothetical protein